MKNLLKALSFYLINCSTADLGSQRNIGADRGGLRQ